MFSRTSIFLAGASLLALTGAAMAQGAPVQLGPLSVGDTASRNTLGTDIHINASPSVSVQDMPQAVTVITSETMQQQDTTTLGDALRNVPGITIAIGEGGTLAGDQFKINGFDAKDDVYLDGLRDFAAYTRDSFNYEQVQVLTGPSGLMFGRGTGGGAINTVSKTAHLGDAYSVNGEIGNGDHYRATGDFNYQLSDTSAVRLNLMYTDTGVVDRDLTHSTRYGIAPTIAFGLGTDTSFTASLSHQQTAARPDYGIVVASPPGQTRALPASEFGVPRSNYIGLQADYDKNTADIVTTKLTHVAADWLTLENDARTATYSRDFRYSSVDTCDNTIATNYCNLRLFGVAQPGAAAGSFDPKLAMANVGGGGPYHQAAWGVQDIGSANADFHIGGFHNVVIAGFDVSYQQSDRTIYAYSLPAGPNAALYPLGDHTANRRNIGWSLYSPTNQPIAGYAPILPTPTSLGSDTTTSVLYSSGAATDLAAFATDRFWFTNEVSLIAGLRIDQYRANYRTTTVGTVANPYPVTTLKAPNFLFDPRASLVWEPDQNQTYYISWGKAATPIGTSVVGSTSPISSALQSALKPDKSETMEIGAKVNVNGIGLTASIFNETKSNALQTDPTSGLIDIQSSQKQRVQGFSTSVTGEVLPQLNITAAYTYLNPVIVADFSSCTTAAATPANPTPLPVCVANPATVGKQITFVPKHAVSLWGDYNARDLLHGLSFGGGIVYQAHLFNAYTAPTVQPAGTTVPVGYPLGRFVEIPETVELDAVAAYELTEKLRFQLNINNLTDRLNYSQSFGNRATPAAGRTFTLSVGYKL